MAILGTLAQWYVITLAIGLPLSFLIALPFGRKGYSASRRARVREINRTARQTSVWYAKQMGVRP